MTSAIDEAAATLGLKLPADARAQLDGYVARLMDANAQFNLTAVREIESVERRLVASSLELLRFMPTGVGSLLDIGSGGGVPGMMLAIARPELQVTLMDATSKKVVFLQDAANVLGLTNVRTVHGRAEDLAHDPLYRERFEIVTARAVARLATLVELAIPFGSVGALAIFPKGTSAQDEVDEARQAIGFVGTRHARVIPSQLDDTQFVLLDKHASSPARFPRRVGIPGKRPIGVPSS